MQNKTKNEQKLNVFFANPVRILSASLGQGWGAMGSRAVGLYKGAFRGQVGAKRPPVGSVSGIRRAGVLWPVCFVWLAKSSSDWQASNDHAKTQAKHLCDNKFFQTQAVARDGPQKETARPCKRQKKRRERPKSTKQRNLWKPRALQNPSSRKHRFPAQLSFPIHRGRTRHRRTPP